jgi:dipeptidyl aminopeptidase/acylaminoacyl peptidase
MRRVVWGIGILTASAAAGAHGQQKRPLTLPDVLTFRQIAAPVISADGQWVAYSTTAEQLPSQVRVQSVARGDLFFEDRARSPEFSRDSRWIACRQTADDGVVLWNLATRRRRALPRCDQFSFSENARWLVLRERPFNGKSSDPYRLLLIELGTERVIVRDDVTDHALAERGDRLLLVAQQDGGKKGKRKKEKKGEPVTSVIERIDLAAAEPAWQTVEGCAATAKIEALTWARGGTTAAFYAVHERSGRDPFVQLCTLAGDGVELQVARHSGDLPGDRSFAPPRRLRFSRDGERLFYMLAPPPEDPAEDHAQADLLALQRRDPAAELTRQQREAGVDVWHWQDPLIKPNEKLAWPRERDRSFAAVLHLEDGSTCILQDDELSGLSLPENGRVALGYSDRPYRREITWDGSYRDVYLVDLHSGERRRIAERLESRPDLSPNGDYVVYFFDPHWFCVSTRTGESRNLTAELSVPFADEDHDYPEAAPDYGLAGWTADDAGVLLYDKFDLWLFPTAGGAPQCITAGQGRAEQQIYRVLRTDPDQQFFAADEELLLSRYGDQSKCRGFARVKLGEQGMRVLLEGDFRADFEARAEDAGTILFTRQTYREFPDLWTADGGFAKVTRISHVNPQIVDHAWGNAELVEWKSAKGTPLQGVLITPDGEVPEGGHPLLVYFYRFFSQRLHDFNLPVINHRPCFPFYASNGYAIFLPDIRFEIGRPGSSATECLVPGVEKLIADGIVDRDAVGLHGHSWSGYQTAFVITETDLFAAAIAGAPVSNMTSAYGGIRWGSGMARQFQYEKTQSRLGTTLWEDRERYIANSPLFFADRIHTPLLIEFGDDDGAVPWYQGIELYLALRRLDKDCVFLQYHGEPHHLRRFANRLDYATKMKEYLDHYLKDAPAAAWIREGVPFKGG